MFFHNSCNHKPWEIRKQWIQPNYSNESTQFKEKNEEQYDTDNLFSISTNLDERLKSTLWQQSSQARTFSGRRDNGGPVNDLLHRELLVKFVQNPIQKVKINPLSNDSAILG